jgi:hypothetical protein
MMLAQSSNICGQSELVHKQIGRFCRSVGFYILYTQGTKKPAIKRAHFNVADSEGFEPPVGLTLRLISSQVH